MSRHTSVNALVFAILAPVFLTACAGAFDAQYPITRQIPPESALTKFNNSLLQNARQQHVSHLGAFEHVEYARYETDDLVLESIYDVSTSVRTVLEYNYWLTRMVDTWNVNSGQSKNWGPSKSVQAWHGTVDLQSYRLVSANRSCFAFNSVWDYQARDSFGRPNRVFFGYVCAKPGKQMSEASVAALIRSVRFDPRSVESLVPANGRGGVDQVAFKAAKGTTGGATGNSEFPFNFGTMYFEGGPERSG